MNTLRYLVVIVVALGCGAAALAQPIITNQPTSLTNLAGTTATFSVGADGTPPLSYEWLYAAGGAPEPLSLQTNALLTLANVQFSNAGDYSVVVSNSEGAITSLVATLTVLTPPRFYVQPANHAASLFADVTFRAAASGDATPLLYQWRFNGAVMPGATSGTLTVTNVQRADAGNYDVVATDSSGSVTSQVATLTIVPFNSIYAFGYSWTDTHNCTWTPATNYWHGQPCNGPMWPQYLSTNLGLAYVAANNYAVCGAAAADVLNQARNYLAPAKPQLSLYCLMFSDDILWAWPGSSGYVNPTNQTRWDQIIQTGVLENSNAIVTLYAKGARTVLAQGELDISKSPYTLLTFGADTNALRKIREYCAKYNIGFSNAVLALGRSWPDLRVIWMDLLLKFDEVLMNPAQYGFTNVTIDALDDSSLADKSFTGPGADYVFWNELHPTTKLHELVTAWNLEALTNSVLETLDAQLEGGLSAVQMNHLQIGRDYTLQKSANLTNWTDLRLFTASAGTNVWTDAENGAVSGFYRLNWQR